jgi:hypothetical protein
MTLPPLLPNIWPTVTPPKNLQIDNKNTKTKTKADRSARAKLKKKNRKGKRHRIVFPLNLRLESGNVYTLQGFSPDFDGDWLVIGCEHRFAGKSGSTTTLELEMVITGY